MDILRILALADMEVRQKTLTLILDLVNSKNIDEVCVHQNACYAIILYRLL